MDPPSDIETKKLLEDAQVINVPALSEYTVICFAVFSSMIGGHVDVIIVPIP